MKCRVCKKEITEENRQKYIGGLQLPYCKVCINQYKASQTQTQPKEHSAQIETQAKARWKTMTRKEKKHTLKIIKQKLKALGLTEKDIEDKLRAEGLSEGAS